MASLEVKRFAGAYSGADLSIPDGPPTASKQIASGGNGTAFGSPNAAAICTPTPVGGSVTLTWPGGVTEVLQSAETRALRGEAVAVS